MCGIAGFSLSSADLALMRPANLTKHLALSIEHRGKDATGMSWADPDGQVWFSKEPLTATQFVQGSFHDEVDRHASTCIIHTRAATQGSTHNPDNNHPIVTDTVIGVHNGIIWNDYELFTEHRDKFDRIAQVDSEIIFQLIAALGTSALSSLEGDASIAWLNISDPDTVHLAALGGRPLAIAETVNGSVLFASEQRSLQQTIDKFVGVELLNIGDVPVGTHLTIRHGMILEWNPDGPTATKPVYSYSTPKSVVSTTTKKSAAPRQVSDAEMTLAVQNLMGVSPEDGDAFSKAREWVEAHVTDMSDVLGSDGFDSYEDEDDLFAEWVWEDDLTGDYPIGDTRRQEAYTKSMNEILVREALTLPIYDYEF